QVEISTGLGASKYYWTGSSYTLNQTWITTTTANPWYYTLPASALANGLYYARLQLTDFAGNPFTTFTSTFTYNTTAPTVTINPLAPNNGFYSALQVSTPFAGTATPAAVSGISVSTVTLSLRDLTVGASYYTGAAWQSGAASFPAQGSVNTWSFNSAGLSFVNDHQYQLTATAFDNAGNSALTNTSFFYDVQAPTSAVTSPAGGSYVTSWSGLSGVANDKLGAPANPSHIGANNLAVAVKRLSDNQWWNGSFSGANPTYYPAALVGADPYTWSVNPAGLGAALPSGTSYYVVSRSSDNAANFEFGPLAANIPAGVGIAFTYNTVAPTATITLPLNNLPG